jgi:2-C-methyl-D-erythritol 2,4-cyclodiphosphate synthase
MLESIGWLLEGKLFFVENIDATIIAEAPSMQPYIGDMRNNIAAALRLYPEQVRVKATSEEGLGFTGSGEGIAAQAVCLLTTPVNLGQDYGAFGGCDPSGCATCGGCGGM